MFDEILSKLESLGRSVPPPPPHDEDCRSRRICRITHCRKEFDSELEGTQSYGGGWYCNYCSGRYLIHARDTGAYHYKTHVRRTVYGYWVYDTYEWYTCDGCSLLTDEEFELTGGSYCHQCYEERYKSEKVKPYNANVLDHCKACYPDADGLLMGVEWELECGRYSDTAEVADEITSAVGEDFCIAKGDGSLRNGIEVVTVPASPKTLMARLKRGIEAIRKNYVSIPSNEKTSSGIHIHVARKFFDNSLQIENFIAFVNNPHNCMLVKHIANRYDTGWCKIFPKGMESWYKSSSYMGKYACVNVLHANTIEVRLFHSTTKYATMAARIQFVAALARFSKLPTTAESTKYNEFLRYVEANRSTYPQLSARLRSLNATGKAIVQ